MVKTTVFKKQLPFLGDILSNSSLKIASAACETPWESIEELFFIILGYNFIISY